MVKVAVLQVQNHLIKWENQRSIKKTKSDLKKNRERDLETQKERIYQGKGPKANNERKKIREKRKRKDPKKDQLLLNDLLHKFLNKNPNKNPNWRRKAHQNLNFLQITLMKFIRILSKMIMRFRIPQIPEKRTFLRPQWKVKF